MNYLKQGEQVMKDLIAEEPTLESYGLLALLYESLPNDASYRALAQAAREKIAELRRGRRADRRGEASAAGSSTLHRPPRGVEGAAAGVSPTPPRPTSVGSAASPAEDTLPRCAVCRVRVTDPQRKDWDRATRAMVYFCSDEHLQARKR